MRVAIVGSRDHPELDGVREYVRALDRSTVVISGGAYGVDWTAVDEAIRLGMAAEEYRAGAIVAVVEAQARAVARERAVPHALPVISDRDALIARNTLIAIACDRMVAFTRGSRGGTWDAIRQAQRFKRPVEIIR